MFRRAALTVGLVLACLWGLVQVTRAGDQPVGPPPLKAGKPADERGPDASSQAAALDGRAVPSNRKVLAE